MPTNQAATQAKTFFPTSAAPTVWEAHHAQLAQPLAPQCLEAMASFLLFFPHHAIATDRELPWQRWAETALQLWRNQAHNSFWDGAWMCFFARLAKNDVHVRAAFLIARAGLVV